MTDAEFDVLDELYFIQPFETIRQRVAMDAPQLKETLSGLVQQDWIRCFESANGDLPADADAFERNYNQYYYLATKAGLLAHNSK